MVLCFGDVKGRRGQVSIEFILLLVLIILMVQTITLPYLSVAEKSASDVLRTAQARVAVQRIYDSVNTVNAAGSDARQSFRVYVPKNSRLACSGNDVGFTVGLELPSEIPTVAKNGCLCTLRGDRGCEEAECTASFATTASSIECSDFSSKANNEKGSFPVMLEVVVSKTDRGVEISAQSG